MPIYKRRKTLAFVFDDFIGKTSFDKGFDVIQQDCGDFLMLRGGNFIFVPFVEHVENEFV